MPFVVRRMRGAPSATPPICRTRSTQGPAQLMIVEPRTVCTCPDSRSRTRTASTPRPPRTISSTWQ